MSWKEVKSNYTYFIGDSTTTDNPYLSKLEALRGVQKLELLQKHQNQDVYLKSFAILEKYYEAE